MSGLLDGLNLHLEPELLAEIEEHKRRIDIIAAQLGKSRKEAAARLLDFEACRSSDGQTLN
jgi:hypothetical protein